MKRKKIQYQEPALWIFGDDLEVDVLAVSMESLEVEDERDNDNFWD